MKSFYGLLGVPEAIGVIVFAFVFLVVASAIVPNKDFGQFKTADFSRRARKKIWLVGPIMLILIMLGFVPFWGKEGSPLVISASQYAGAPAGSNVKGNGECGSGDGWSRRVPFGASIGNQEAELKAAGELHEYSLDVYHRERIVIEIADLGNNQDMRLCFEFSGDLESIKSDSASNILRMSYSNDGPTSKFSLRLWDAKKNVGKYRLSIRDLTAEPGVPLVYGEHVFGSFTRNQEVDSYQFNGVGGDKVSLIVHDPDDDDGIVQPRVELLQVSGVEQLKTINENWGTRTLAFNEKLPQDGLYKVMVQNRSGTAGSYFVCLENSTSVVQEHVVSADRSMEMERADPLFLLSFMASVGGEGKSPEAIVLSIGEKKRVDRPVHHIVSGGFAEVVAAGSRPALKIKAVLLKGNEGASIEVYRNSKLEERFSLRQGEMREIKGSLIIEFLGVSVNDSYASKNTGSCCVVCGGTTNCGCAIETSCGSCCIGGCCAL